MKAEEKIECLEKKLKQALSWWRTAEKKLSQKCEETKANQKSIEQLKAENAALRERLERAVELPVKLGDEVFFFDFDKIEVQQGKVIGIRWNYFTPSNPVWVSVQYDIPMIKRDCGIEVWLGMVFTTREAAEARLAELKGESHEQ